MGLRETLHHQPEPKKPKKPEPPADPNHPHAYKAPGEHWMGDGVPPTGGSGIQGMTPVFAIGAGMQFADRHCAICRRDKDDLIHAPED